MNEDKQVETGQTVSPSVLIIDHEEEAARNLARVFETAGFAVTLSHSGSDGISQIYQEHPNLVIVRALLPELDGYQICRLLRHDISTRHLMIILLTEPNHSFGVPWDREVGADSLLDHKAMPVEVLAMAQELLAEHEWIPCDRTDEEQQMRERRKQWNRRVSFILEEKLYRTTLVSRVNSGICVHDDPIANRRAVMGQLSQAVDFLVAIMHVEGDRNCVASLRSPVSKKSTQPLLRLMRDNMASHGEAPMRLPEDVEVILGADYLADSEVTLASTATAAMHSGDRVIGYLAIGAARPNAFSTDDLGLLELFALQAGSVLEIAVLNERNAVLAAAIENLRDGVLLTDLQETVIHSNPAAQQLFHLTSEELHGHRVRRVLSPHFPTEHASRIFQETNEGGWRGEALGIRAGTNFPLALDTALVRMRSGAPLGMVLICRDLTRDKQQEQERLQATELSTLLETAVALNHEINNPLQAILSCVQLLQYQLKDDASPEIEDKLRMIVEQAQRIADVTRKLEQAKSPVRRPYVLGQRMIDIEASAKQH